MRRLLREDFAGKGEAYLPLFTVYFDEAKYDVVHLC